MMNKKEFIDQTHEWFGETYPDLTMNKVTGRSVNTIRFKMRLHAYRVTFIVVWDEQIVIKLSAASLDNEMVPTKLNTKELKYFDTVGLELDWPHQNQFKQNIEDWYDE